MNSFREFPPSSHVYTLIVPQNKSVAGGTRLTVRVVGVDTGVGCVPALDGPVDAPAEALLATGAHGDTQNSAATGQQTSG